MDLGPGPCKTMPLKNLDPEEPRPRKTWETAGYGKMIRRPLWWPRAAIGKKKKKLNKQTKKSNMCFIKKLLIN